MSKSHFKLHQPVKIDGVDFEAGVYSVHEIDSGRQSSIVNAGWGDYCDAPKSKSKVTTDDDVDPDEVDLDDVEETKAETKPEAEPKTPAKPKPARSRAKK